MSLPIAIANHLHQGRTMAARAMLTAFLIGIPAPTCVQAREVVQTRSAHSRYGRVQVRFNPKPDLLLFNGRKLLDVEEDIGEDLLGFGDRWRIGRSDLFIVTASNGGSSGGGCPTQYLVLEIRGAHRARLTKPFGTCAPSAKTLIVGGKLVIDMPEKFAWRDRDPVPKHVRRIRFVYSHGKVSKPIRWGYAPESYYDDRQVF